MQVESPVSASQTGEMPQMTSVRSPLRVQNQVGNVTVFSKTINGDRLSLTLQPHGHPGDTVRAPLVLAEDIDFLNALESGTLKITGGPKDVMDALQFETEQVRAERTEQEQASVAMLERRQDNDMVASTCIGPAAPGRSGKCDRPVLQRAAQKNLVPPLCPNHLALAPTFSLIEVGSKGDVDSGAREGSAGRVQREWRAATMMPTVVVPD